MMSIKAIVFSPTGGTKAVCDILAREIGPDPFEIDLTDRFADHEQIALSADDVVVIAMPCYAGRVPALAAERFRRISGQGARAVVVAVYGNRAYDDELVELVDLAHDGGFRVIAGVAAVAEHSIVREYAAGRPDTQDVQDLADIAARIREKLAAADDSVPDVPRNRPYKDVPAGGNVPEADAACVHCGTCAAHCPNGAIDPEHPARTDAARCISCMRCVSICPAQARRIDPAKTAAIREKLRDVCSVRKAPECYL